MQICDEELWKTSIYAGYFDPKVGYIAELSPQVIAKSLRKTASHPETCAERIPDPRRTTDPGRATARTRMERVRAFSEARPDRRWTREPRRILARNDAGMRLAGLMAQQAPA